MNPETAARLENLGIVFVGDQREFSVFARGDCIVLAHRNPTGFDSIGSVGLMTPSGLAYLFWRGDRAMMVGKQTESPAAPEQIEAIRSFSTDLKSALGL